jgi:hypothetical protein
LLTISSAWTYIYEYRYVYGAVFILVGLFLGLLGRKVFVVSIFLAAAFISLLIILYVYYAMFLTNTTPGWVGWAVLGGAFVVGSVLGLACTRFARVGATLIAIWGGFIVGLIINESVLYLLEGSLVFWVVCASCAAVLGVLVFVTYNHAVILSTSLIGSYLFVRGISLYAGGYPNEYLLINEIKNGIIQPAERRSLYFYIAGILASTVICAIVQYRQLARMDEYEKHPYEQLR